MGFNCWVILTELVALRLGKMQEFCLECFEGFVEILGPRPLLHTIRIMRALMYTHSCKLQDKE